MLECPLFLPFVLLRAFSRPRLASDQFFFLFVVVGRTLSDKFLLRIVTVLILFRFRRFLSRHFPVFLHAIVLHPALE